GWEGGCKIPSLHVVLALDGTAGVFASWVDESWIESWGSWNERVRTRVQPRVLGLPAEPFLAAPRSASFGDGLGNGDGLGDLLRLTVVADGTGGAFGVWQESSPDVDHWVIVAEHRSFSPGGLGADGARAVAHLPIFALAPPRPNPAADAVAIEF